MGWLLAALLLQDAHRQAVQGAVEKTACTSYAYRVVGRFERTGRWQPPDLFVAQIGGFDAVRRGAQLLVKGPEGLWKTPGQRIGEVSGPARKDVEDMMRTLEEARAAHRMAADLLAAATKVLPGEDRASGGTACRVWFLSFTDQRLREEVEKHVGTAIERGAMKKPDEYVWASIRGNAQIYVGKQDGLIRRITDQSTVKVRFKTADGGRPDETNYKLDLTVELSEFGKAAIDLPPEVKALLDAK